MFLAEQRQRRIDRIGRMIARSRSSACSSTPTRSCGRRSISPAQSIGRPAIARALVAAGYVTDTERGVRAAGCRAAGPASCRAKARRPTQVIAQIHGAGGVASLAHPGLLRRDEWIAGLASSGLDAIEAYHTNHDEAATGRYRSIAHRLGLAVSGGSDYHADESHGAAHPGSVSLPADAFDQLRERATSRPPPRNPDGR